jgi:MFS family permease
MFTLFRSHGRALVLGTFAALSTFVIFYLMTVFALSWGTSALHYRRPHFLLLQMAGVLFLALAIPLSALWADRAGPRRVLIAADIGIILFGLLFQPLFGSGSTLGVLAFLSLGLGLMGLIYGPLGTALAGLFPTEVRHLARHAPRFGVRRVLPLGLSAGDAWGFAGHADGSLRSSTLCLPREVAQS